MKKPYARPELKKLGLLREITKTIPGCSVTYDLSRT
jgi:hypothetical protein